MRFAIRVAHCERPIYGTKMDLPKWVTRLSTNLRFTNIQLKPGHLPFESEHENRSRLIKLFRHLLAIRSILAEKTEKRETSK